MSEMKDLDKLRVLLPHWIEHNNGHIVEFARWRERAAIENGPAAAALEEAINAMRTAGAALDRVLAELGGPLKPPAHSHHHHHHHD